MGNPATAQCIVLCIECIYENAPKSPIPSIGECVMTQLCGLKAQ